VRSNTILIGDALEQLRTLPDESVHCCVTSPPYWGLRDYGEPGQLGLESTPEEYVANMVEVFREVRRVLRVDGTLWLNLGSSYANTSPVGPQGKTGDRAGRTFTANGSGGMRPSQSPLLQRVPACGSGGTGQSGSPVDDRACRGSCGEPPAETSSRRDRTPRTGQSAGQDEQPLSQTGRDTSRPDSASTSPDASPRAAQESTIDGSPLPPSDASVPSPSDVASTLRLTACDEPLESAHTAQNTHDTPPMSPPLVVRTSGKESFFSACGRSDCQGVGRCGFCWCSLSIPSLSFKQKDLVDIPHLVAFALQADGWYLRSDIVWNKPNPMPESVTDRPTKAHEMVFLLSRSPRYFYDSAAVRESDSGRPSGNGFVRPERVSYGGRGQSEQWLPGAGRNRRSVWTIATKPFPEAHFAVMPPALASPCVLAGSPRGGLVLDPFMGAGTVGLVAAENGRDYIGIELNPEYAAMAEHRIVNRGRRVEDVEALPGQEVLFP